MTSFETGNTVLGQLYVKIAAQDKDVRLASTDQGPLRYGDRLPEHVQQRLFTPGGVPAGLVEDAKRYKQWQSDLRGPDVDVPFQLGSAGQPVGEQATYADGQVMSPEQYRAWWKQVGADRLMGNIRASPESTDEAKYKQDWASIQAEIDKIPLNTQDPVLIARYKQLVGQQQGLSRAYQLRVRQAANASNPLAAEGTGSRDTHEPPAPGQGKPAAPAAAAEDGWVDYGKGMRAKLSPEQAQRYTEAQQRFVQARKDLDAYVQERHGRGDYTRGEIEREQARAAYAAMTHEERQKYEADNLAAMSAAPQAAPSEMSEYDRQMYELQQHWAAQNRAAGIRRAQRGQGALTPQLAQYVSELKKQQEGAEAKKREEPKAAPAASTAATAAAPAAPATAAAPAPAAPAAAPAAPAPAAAAGGPPKAEARFRPEQITTNWLKERFTAAKDTNGKEGLPDVIHALKTLDLSKLPPTTKVILSWMGVDINKPKDTLLKELKSKLAESNIPWPEGV